MFVGADRDSLLVTARVDHGGGDPVLDPLLAGDPVFGGEDEFLLIFFLKSSSF